MRKKMKDVCVGLALLLLPLVSCDATVVGKAPHIESTSEVESSTLPVYTSTILTSTVVTYTTITYTTTTTQEVSTEIVTEPETEEIIASPISESERVMLCNLVGREYGSDHVPVAEKAKVVSVVMNRVNSPYFPNTVYEVITQPDQFSAGYIPVDSYSPEVTDTVIEAVDYYFEHEEEFSSDIYYFVGDGYWNYFS